MHCVARNAASTKAAGAKAWGRGKIHPASCTPAVQTTAPTPAPIP